MSLSSGERIGPYEILGPLGRGGMGEVYRGRDPRLERDVALKVIREGRRRRLILGRAFSPKQRELTYPSLAGPSD